MSTTKQTTALTSGDTVDVEPTLNSSGYRAVVSSVTPWVLTAGPKTGQQAKSNGRPLFTVTLSDVVLTAPSLRPLDDASAAADASVVRRVAAPASRVWTVLS